MCDGSCSAIFDESDILRIVLCRGLVRRVVSLPKESLGKLVTDFFKTFKIVDFRRDF